MRDQVTMVSPKSEIGMDFACKLNFWSRIICYFTDSVFYIDNNLFENIIWPAAVVITSSPVLTRPLIKPQ